MLVKRHSYNFGKFNRASISCPCLKFVQRFLFRVQEIVFYDFLNFILSAKIHCETLSQWKEIKDRKLQRISTVLLAHIDCFNHTQHISICIVTFTLTEIFHIKKGTAYDSHTTHDMLLNTAQLTHNTRHAATAPN